MNTASAIDFLESLGADVSRHSDVADDCVRGWFCAANVDAFSKRNAACAAAKSAGLDVLIYAEGGDFALVLRGLVD